MNERIEEIRSICYIPNSQDRYDMDKFAELLIEESLKVMQQEWYDLNNAPAVENESSRDVGLRVGQKSEVIMLMAKIRNHFDFGVKND